MFSHITKDFLGNKFSIATGFVFITIGLLFGSWATFIPYIKESFQLDDRQLGLLLLSIPLGALTMNPVAAGLIRKKGILKTISLGLIILLFSFAILLFIHTIFVLPLVMFGCGAGISITNVGINTCVGAVENQFKVKIMSTCHGMFSVGLMLGSLAASLIGLKFENPGFYMLFSTALLFFGNVFALKLIYKIHEEKPKLAEVKPKFQFPSGPFLTMIVISLCINITEGTMADWSAVYMREVVNAKTYFIGWGMSAYSLLMALGRFSGDKIIPKYGANKILVGGGILTIIGISTAVLLPSTFFTILGFSFVGAGVSCGAPILYASAARVPNMPKGAGLAILNTFAMGGFLFGPVLIGFISKAFSLSLAFTIIAILGLFWITKSRKVKLF